MDMNVRNNYGFSIFSERFFIKYCLCSSSSNCMCECCLVDSSNNRLLRLILLCTGCDFCIYNQGQGKPKKNEFEVLKHERCVYCSALVTVL